RAAVARCRVVELVLRRDGEAEGAARGGARRCADREVGGRGGADGDGAAGGGNGGGDGVGRGDGLVARGLQRGAKGASAVRQRAVGGHARLPYTALFRSRAAVARCRVVELVLRRDGEAEGGSRSGAGWGAHAEVGSRGGTD